MKLSTIILINLLSCLYSGKLLAQEIANPSQSEIGRRFVQNYDPKDYGSRTQNWDIIQDQRGLIYVANGSGIMEYDGVNWRMIHMSNFGTPLCMALDEQDRLFVGGAGDMGYLAIDSIGAKNFRSLVSILPDSLQDISYIRNIEIWEGDAYFRSRHHIFQIDLATLSLDNVWTAPGRINAQRVGDDLYMWRGGLDWGKVSGDSLITYEEPLEQLSIFPDFLPYPNSQADKQEVLVFPSEGEPSIFDGENFSPFNLDEEIKNYLEQYVLFECEYLGEGTYLLRTENGGALIIDQNGSLIAPIDKGSGVKNINIFHGYKDQNQNVWVGSNFGISKMEAFSPFSFLGEEDGFNELILNIIRHKGKLYIGTYDGVFQMITSEKSEQLPQFQQVENLTSTCFSLYSDGDILLAGGREGVFQVIGNQVENITPGVRIPYCFLASKHDPNVMYVGYVNGLLVLKKQAGKWKWAGTLEGVSGGVPSIVEAEPGTLWLGGDANGIRRVQLSEDSRKLINKGQADNSIPTEITQFAEEADLPKGAIKVQLLAGRMVFLTQKGLRKFDLDTQSFIPENAFGEEMADTNMFVYRIAKNLNGRITVLNDYPKLQDTRNLTASLIPNDEGGYTYEYRDFNRMPVPMMGPLQVLYPDPAQPDILWMGGKELIRYDMSKEKSLQSDFPVYLRSIKTSEDSTIYHGNIWPESFPKIAFKDNSLRFTYAAAYFQSEDETNYQIYLEGNDKGWSEWSNETYANYTNLSEGSYRFHIRARNVAFHTSESVPFEFEILPPWYRTWWAYVLYFLMAGLFIGIIVRLYSKWRVRQLEAENRALEQTVAERTVEILSAFEALKATQNQLLLKEKMASLGELSMGIAHEIKNPLNFVKNFAEGANELLSELEEDWKSYQESRDPEDLDLFQETLESVRKNNQFIIKNGNRANQIVDEMMNHSDILGKKSEIAINQLMEEQINLAMYGFNSNEDYQKITIHKDFGDGLPSLFLHPQELGRVVINMINNAYYALEQKSKDSNENFEPTIHIQTQCSDDMLTIRIRDNGIGIPESIQSKIFQPFFTTKPTGKGNIGLGLSISYDIITKGLQGKVEIESEEKEFTEVKILIPVSKNQQVQA